MVGLPMLFRAYRNYLCFLFDKDPIISKNHEKPFRVGRSPIAGPVGKSSGAIFRWLLVTGRGPTKPYSSSNCGSGIVLLAPPELRLLLVEESRARVGEVLGPCCAHHRLGL